MIEELNITVDQELISQALDELPSFDFRVSINEPTGNWFYDPWQTKAEFTNTIWEYLLNTLPYDIGEARIVSLEEGTAYLSHADVDDRWHLPLTNDQSYLLDLENKIMFECKIGVWQSMDASILHTAGNFGHTKRIHLLVRKLLTEGNLKDPVTYQLQADTAQLVPHRYIFDHVYSPLLNKLNKQGMLRNFTKTETSVCFETERSVVIPSHEAFIIKK